MSIQFRGSKLDDIMDLDEASSPQNTAPIFLPIRRDFWDSIDFYLSILWVFAAAGWGVMQFTAVSAITSRLPNAGGAHLPPFLLIAAFTIQVIVGSLFSFMFAWRRFAERLVLTPSELLWELGYSTIRIPLIAIDRVHPMGIVRLSTTIKRGGRVWMSQSPATDVNSRLSVLRWLSRFLTPRFIAATEYNSAQPYFDLSPRDLDRFLEELAGRCPHLEREGPRLVRKAGSTVGV